MKICSVSVLGCLVLTTIGWSVVRAQAPSPSRPKPSPGIGRPIRWSAGLTVAQVMATTIAGVKISSSSKLRVDWQSPGVAIDHYEVQASDSVTSEVVGQSSTTETLTLSGLKSATTYTVTVKACLDKTCGYALTSVGVTGATSEEYWQVQGSGNSYTTGTRVVADGNIGAHVMRYGSWAGTSLNGRLQMYYNPVSGTEKGAKPALTAVPATSSLLTVNSFQGASGVGLINPCPVGPPGQPPASCPGTGLVKNLALFQAVPMIGYVRLYLEATGTDQKNRILYLDSQDGYVGRDFNRGTRTICQTISDYGPGGECEPQVAIGVQGDAVAGNVGVGQARQFKILIPMLDNDLEGRFTGATGTAMVFTITPFNTACSTYNFTQGYAIWDGTRWQVQYRADGCPKLFEAMQAPNPVHLGGVRYKLYYNNTTSVKGQPSNPLTDLKVMKVLYANGSRTGDALTVDFEDWEPTSKARDMVILWPDGTKMNDDNESKFDDHVTLMPTRDPGFQVIYANMSNSQITPFIGMAVLVNP